MTFDGGASHGLVCSNGFGEPSEMTQSTVHKLRYSIISFNE